MSGKRKPPSRGAAAGKCLDGACDMLEAFGRPEGRQLRAGVAGVYDTCIDMLGEDGIRAAVEGDFERALMCLLSRRATRRR